MYRKWDELHILQPDTTNPEEIQERKDQERVFQLLANLDSSYEKTRSQILLNSILPSLEKITAIIEQEETRQSVMRGPQISTEKEREAQALTIKFHKNPNFKGTTQIKCTHCK
jgi:hypothetical protein